MRRSLTTLGPFVIASRMVRDYTEQLYEPAAAQGDAMSESAFGRARELASWKERVRAGFEGVHIDHIDLDVSVADIGVDRGAEDVVALGSLTPDDVEAQPLHGPVRQGEEIGRAHV